MASSSGKIANAIVGGMVAAIVGAILWAAVTVATGFQIGYMAIGVGFLVGYAMRFFGGGGNQIYGVAGAILALLGSALGNVLSGIGLFANQEGIAITEALGFLNPSVAVELLTSTTGPMDLLFYGLAVYFGYRYSSQA